MSPILRMALILFLMLICQLQAQLEVTVKPQRQDYLLGEDIHVELVLYNNSTSAISLAKLPGRPWLSLEVGVAGDARLLAPKVVANYPSVSLPPGRKMAYKINLSQSYAFNMDGDYRLSAIVRMPDMKTAYSSPKSRFRLSNGSLHKKFITHVRGKRLEMRAKFWQIGNKNAIFGQVADADSGRVIGAAYMGSFLNFMEPRYLLDAKQNLHMLFQSTPEFFTYSILSTTGKCSFSKIYKRAPGGPVTLVSRGGAIQVIGAVPYEKPKAEERHRDATERPF